MAKMQRLTDKINRQIAADYLTSLISDAAPGEEMNVLLDAATIKVQERAGKLTLTFDVDGEDHDGDDSAAFVPEGGEPE